MRFSVIQKLILSIFAVFLLIPNVTFANREVFANYIYINNIFIKSYGKDHKDPAILAANVYIPRSKDKNAKFPVIIFPNSWGFNQYEYRKQAEKFAKNGYIAFSYSARGWGKSTGIIGVGGVNDIMDIHHIINWILKNTPANENEIGMAGISYGAGLTLLGAEHDKRVKVIAAMSGWSNLVDSLYFNHTPSILWTKVLFLSADLKQAKLKGLAKIYLKDISNYRISKALENWGYQRSPITYINQLNKRHVAVFLSNNYQDGLFKPSDMLHFYYKLDTPKRFDLNQGDHATAEWGGILGKKNYIWNNVLAWFNHYLKHENNTIANGIYMQPAGKNQLHQLTNLNSNNIIQQKLYLAGTNKKGYGKLEAQPSEKETYSNWLTQGDSGFTSGAWPYAFMQLWSFMENKPKTVHKVMNDFNPAHGSLYVTAPLTKANLKIIRGAPELHLCIKILKRKNGAVPKRHVITQLIAYLYEISPNGVGQLIDLAPFTIYNNTSTNKVINIHFPLGLAAYNLSDGYKLGLAIGTKDNLFAANEDYWKNYQVKILAHSGSHYSYITIPYLKKTNG